jgi:hypothetical protein
MSEKVANRRSRASGNPEYPTKSRIPAFAGKTFSEFS